jgi:rubrerythrin
VRKEEEMGKKMDLASFGEQELILTAMKSEVESRDFYSGFADRVRNFLLKEKLDFLSGEEEKHRTYFENMYRDRYPGEKLELPGISPVPLPQLKISSESVPISELFTQAMDAEMAARDFYTGLAERLLGNEQVKKTVLYIAAMEMGHYKLLEVERESADKYEDFDVEWPLTHVGP